MMLVQIVIGLVLLAAFVLVSSSVRGEPPGDKENTGVFTALKVRAMTRESVRKSLRLIEAKTPPSSRMGAMCYKPVMAPEVLEYVCPLDGEKSVYSNRSEAYGQAYNAIEIRKQADQLDLALKSKGLGAYVLEKRLCCHCMPGVNDRDRYLSLVLVYPDGRSVQTDRIFPDDIRYLMGFFSGGLTYATSNDGEEPLKAVHPRLKQLLGE
jgi:hypothetical protein